MASHSLPEKPNCVLGDRRPYLICPRLDYDDKLISKLKLALVLARRHIYDLNRMRNIPDESIKQSVDYIDELLK